MDEGEASKVPGGGGGDGDTPAAAAAEKEEMWRQRQAVLRKSFLGVRIETGSLPYEPIHAVGEEDLPPDSLYVVRIQWGGPNRRGRLVDQRRLFAVPKASQGAPPSVELLKTFRENLYLRERISEDLTIFCGVKVLQPET